MNENKMMNVLVLGASGAGKSTLIKSQLTNVEETQNNEIGVDAV